jgi:FkbM family methyltransferase
MIQKVISNIKLGLKGIFNNKYLRRKQKIFLYADYIKFLFLLFLVYFFKKSIHKVKINSFKYTVYFEKYITFFYIFNEIFCKEVYIPIKINSYYDLGANIGLTILWYKYFNPSLQVYAFEPDPKNYKYLQKNIKINQLTNINTYPIALSDKKGKAKFFVIKDNIQNLDSGLTLNQKLPYKCIQINTDLLSKYITKKVDLLKIDIEGGEYKVFEDLFVKNKIKLFKEIIFEAHFFNKKERDILKLLVTNLKKTGGIKKLENSQHTKVFSYQSFKN